jgi:hypothetical protein
VHHILARGATSGGLARTAVHLGVGALAVLTLAAIVRVGLRFLLGLCEDLVGELAGIGALHIVTAEQLCEHLQRQL